MSAREADIQRAVDLAHEEVKSAIHRFYAFNSPHEGWAVIREEMDELWDHVRANTGHSPEAMKEAIQIAAMALRYVLDLSQAPEGVAWGPNHPSYDEMGQ